MLNSLVSSINNVFYSVMSKVPVIGGLFGHIVDAPTNVKAFFMVIRSRESSEKDDAYRMVFGGKLINDLSDHPCNTGEWKGGSYNGKTATPAGAYQFTLATWNRLKKKLNLPDFTPPSQDKGAIQLLKECGAYTLLDVSKVNDALRVASPIWASLPFSDSGQPKQSLDNALKTYKKYGGTIS